MADLVSVKKQWSLTKESFDSLLAWLDPERERAGETYEVIRARLIKVFAYRGCHTPEELADETINRVAKKVDSVAESYDGDPALYFYGVARNLVREYENSRRVLVSLDSADTPIVDDTDDDIEQVDACLSKCLGKLASEDRELALAYYQKDGQAKIDLRRALAEKIGIDSNALRVRMYRMRGSLAQCIERCLSNE